jgi:hypothetical protein
LTWPLKYYSEPLNNLLYSFIQKLAFILHEDMNMWP